MLLGLSVHFSIKSNSPNKTNQGLWVTQAPVWRFTLGERSS